MVSKPLVASGSSSNSSSPEDNSAQQSLPISYYYSALRTAVHRQTWQFKQDAFNQASQTGLALRCPVEGTPLTLDDSDVDHVPPTTFKHLADSWLKQEGIEPQQVQLQNAWFMACPEQERSSQQYHQQYAVLRLLSSRANRQPRRQSSSSNIRSTAVAADNVAGVSSSDEGNSPSPTLGTTCNGRRRPPHAEQVGALRCER